MNFSRVEASVEEIDDADVTYRISTRTDLQDILPSLESVGLINPPICRKSGQYFQVISGFRRIWACRQLGFSSLPVRVLAMNHGERQRVEIAVCENASQRPLNLVEFSRAFALLSRLYPRIEDLAQTSRKLGIPSGPEFIRKVMPLCSAESGIQEGVINETISLQTALELQSFPKEDVVALADMLNSIKLSVNNQREVLNLLKEIAARDSISILQILNEAPVGPILADPDMDRNRKTQRLRSVLREKRFSRLSEIEHRFDQWVRRLKLPPGIDLIAPKHFEATHFILQIRFKNSKELRDHLEFSQKLPETHLEHILKF